MQIAALAELLHETAEHHDSYEKSHASHNWWDWYAAYISARRHGSTPLQASVAAGHYMAEVLRIQPRALRVTVCHKHERHRNERHDRIEST